MISNYYILHSVVQEIRERLIGMRFLRAYSIRAAELRMEFESGDTLVAQLQPAHTTLYLSRNSEREPKRNVMSFFKELEGQTVSKIEIAENDKLVTVYFGEYSLLLRFYDGPNALLYSKGELLAEFKRERSAKQKVSKPVTEAKSERDVIKQKLPMLGKWLEAELLAEVTKLGSGVDLAGECNKFDRHLRESKEGYLYSANGASLLSPIILRTLSESYKKYENVSEAIEFVTKSRTKESSFKSKKDALLSKLHGAIARTIKALSDATSGIENSERAERYNAIADGIQAIAHEIEKGRESIELSIFEKDIEIPLDPSLTSFENAKRFYDKARRAREMQKELQVRLVSLTKEKQKLAAFSEKVVNAPDVKQLEAIEKELSKEGFALSHTSDDLGDDSDPTARFRKFIVSGGFRVLVGKNAKQNDELTIHVAKKEDLWFHARHVPGSHVVLQSGNAKQIPKEAIEQAAEIAAYYSDAKTQKHAPVAYTKKKFVRKPRGAAPGAVLLEREEVVIVTPRNPEEK
ncbi:MAG: NFACT RNA binding domain-containing protein [Candidatus Kapaibacterium sp.]